MNVQINTGSSKIKIVLKITKKKLDRSTGIVDSHQSKFLMKPILVLSA